MTTIEIKAAGAILNGLREPVVSDDSGVEDSFSIEVAGLGQLAGLSYTVPAHATGKLTADLQTAALTSEDVAHLNALAMSMLDASHQEEVRELEKTSVSANVTPWAKYFGRNSASASYQRIRETMKSKGLTDPQVSELMSAFMERATNMSKVTLDFFVDNSMNDYSVSGDLYLYTISGKVKTKKGTKQYRMLADRAAAGGPPPSGGGAPSAGVVKRKPGSESNIL